MAVDLFERFVYDGVALRVLVAQWIERSPPKR